MKRTALRARLGLAGVVLLAFALQIALIGALAVSDAAPVILLLLLRMAAVAAIVTSWRAGRPARAALDRPALAFLVVPTSDGSAQEQRKKRQPRVIQLEEIVIEGGGGRIHLGKANYAFRAGSHVGNI